MSGSRTCRVVNFAEIAGIFVVVKNYLLIERLYFCHEILLCNVSSAKAGGVTDDSRKSWTYFLPPCKLFCTRPLFPYIYALHERLRWRLNAEKIHTCREMFGGEWNVMCADREFPACNRQRINTK